MATNRAETRTNRRSGRASQHRGFSYPTVKRMRQFYLTFPQGSALRESGAELPRREDGRDAAPPEDGSTALTRSGEAENGSTALSLFPPLLGWSHYLALLFERLTLQKGEDEIRELASRGQEVAVPSNVLRDPFVLKFVDLRERLSALERDLEQAIIEWLEVGSRTDDDSQGVEQ